MEWCRFVTYLSNDPRSMLGDVIKTAFLSTLMWHNSPFSNCQNHNKS